MCERAIVIGMVMFLASPAAAQPTFDPPQSVGVINSALLTEASGIAASRRTPGALWTHNDSGDSARVFAFDVQARLLGTYTISGVTALDVEDVAVGPGPSAGVHYLYVGDIGDNLAIRSSIRVHRFPEPAINLSAWASPGTSSLAGRVTITLNYPDGPRDSEALMIDPVSGDLVIVSKQATAGRVYTASAAAIANGGTVVLTYQGLATGDRITAGEISPDGTVVGLRTLDTARVWAREPGQTIAQALAAPGSPAPVTGRPVEPQGEAIGFAADGSGYYTVSEGTSQPLRFAARHRCVGDTNCDFALNGLDVEIMELAIGGDTTDICLPDPDVNGDSALNGLDVEAVELAVGGAGCS